MELSKREHSVTEDLRLTWVGEHLLHEDEESIRTRGKEMRIEEVRAHFYRAGYEEDWSGYVTVRGPVRLAQPLDDGREWSRVKYSRILHNYDEYPWIVALLKQEIPDFELPAEDDDE